MKNFFIFLLFLINFSSFAEVLQYPTPVSSTQNVVPVDFLPEYILPPIDVETLLKEDEQNAGRKDIPFRYGAEINTQLDLLSNGFYEQLENGDYLIKIKIRSYNAYSLSFQFKPFHLPGGSQLFIYSPDKAVVWGPYTSFNNKRNEFWTPAVPYDCAVIELYLPAYIEENPLLTIKSTIHAYKNNILRMISPDKPNPGGSGSCNVDVECERAQWSNEINSVAHYTFGIYMCTGTLINRILGDCVPYFWTANHCVSTNADASKVVTYWNFERSGCGSGNGPTNHTVGNSTLIWHNSTSDGSLLQLDYFPPDLYTPYLAGWDAVDSAPNSATCIHHPSGDYKKISHENNPLTITSYGGNTSPGDGTHLRVADWDSGTTEGGSSGSGLWSNSSRRLVGQLHGGYAACGNNSADWFGRFKTSYDLGAKTYLDPNNTGQTYVNGKNYTQCSTCTPPNTPSGLTITGNCNSVSLSWTGSGATGYNIYRKTGTCGGTYTQIASGITTTTYNDTGVTVGSTYAYVVRGYSQDVSCESADTNCVSTTVQSTPSAPSAPTISDDCNGLIVSWSSASGATSYNVYRRTGGCGKNGWGQVATGITSTNWTDTNASLGSTYGYYIEAVNNCGTATNGNNACGSGTHNLQTPSAPTNLVATGTCTSIDLTWNASTGATSFKILRTTNSNCSTGLTQIGTSSTNSYSDTTAQAGTTYYYVVQAVNSCGTSSNSNCANAIRSSVPSAPTNLVATGTCTSIDLTWNASTGATSYNILRTTNSNCSTGLTQIGTSSTNSYSDTTAQAGTTYYYVVQAVNSCGTSSNSNCANAIRSSVPSAPQAPTYTNVSCNTLTVNWSSVPLATSYDLYRRTGACGTGSLIASNLTGTSYDDSGLSQNTQYSYYLVAKNSCGNSTNGACSSVTTTGAPSQPTNLVAAGTCTSIDLTWNASTGATSYNILRTTNSNCSTGLTQIGTSATNSYSDTTAQAGTTYYYVVQAVNSCGTSSNSNCANALRLSAPSAPTITNITDESSCAQSGIRVYYNAGSGATSHELYKDGSLAQSNYNSGALYNPGDSNSHSYFIRATNSCGSADSSSQNFTDANNSTTPTITGPSSNTCPSNSVLLSTESGMTNYQWYLNGNPISGANSYQYTATQSGNYTVSYTNTFGCSGTSAPKSITINPCIPNIVYYSNGGLVSINEDGDGIPEAGEKWQLTVTVINNGEAPATNIFGSLAGEGITVCNNPGNFGNLDVNQTSSYTFIFIIDSNYWYSTYSCGSSIGFDLINKSSDGGTYNYADDLNFLTQQVGQLGGTTTENATAPDITNVKNNTKTSIFSPSFTLTPNVDNATVSFTLSGTTDLTNCVLVELLAPDSSALILKNYGDVAQSSYDATSFYNLKGAGSYTLRVTEASGCGAANNNANCSSISMSVSKTTGSNNCDTSSFSCLNIAGEVSDDFTHHLKVNKNGTNVNLQFEDIGAQYYNIYVSNNPNTHSFSVLSSQDGKKDCHIIIDNDLGEMLEVLNYNLESGIIGDTSILFILISADNGFSTEGTLGKDSNLLSRTADSYCNK